MDGDAQTRLGIAALFAALVKALGEKDRGLTTAFERHLAEMAETLEESGAASAGAVEVLERTRHLLAETDLETDEPAWIVYRKQTDPDLVETLQHDHRVPVATLSEALVLWEKLPQHDRDGSIIETMSGQRLDAAGIEKVLAKQRHLSAGRSG